MLSAAAALYGALTDIREIYFSEAANSVCVQEKKIRRLSLLVLPPLPLLLLPPS
jgi:hypothetical protein